MLNSFFESKLMWQKMQYRHLIHKKTKNKDLTTQQKTEIRKRAQKE